MALKENRLSEGLPAGSPRGERGGWYGDSGITE